MELASAYQPQNWYCYAIDSKARWKFHARMLALTSCLPNVIVTTHEYPTDGGGNNFSEAYLECMQQLLRPNREWKYVSLLQVCACFVIMRVYGFSHNGYIILQNHDINLRTNAEAVQIFQLLNGSNDVEVTYLPRDRVNMSQDWSFESLRLFRNESRNKLPPPNGYPPQLIFAKGYSESSLSREMVRLCECSFYSLSICVNLGPLYSERAGSQHATRQDGEWQSVRARRAPYTHTPRVGRSPGTGWIHARLYRQ